LSAEDLKKIKSFLEWIKVLKQPGMTRFGIVASYLCHQVQPLKARASYGFEYAGAKDPSRMVSTQELREEEILEHLQKILKGVSVIPHRINEFTAMNLPPSVSLFLS
jgi:chorismate mutase